MFIALIYSAGEGSRENALWVVNGNLSNPVNHLQIICQLRSAGPRSAVNHLQIICQLHSVGSEASQVICKSFVNHLSIAFHGPEVPSIICLPVVNFAVCIAWYRFLRWSQIQTLCHARTPNCSCLAVKPKHNILKTSSFNGVYRRFPYYPPGGVARFSAVGG